MTDIMFDLETVDSCSTSGIISIGACKIDWRLRQTSDHFYVVIDKDSSLSHGLTMSQQTMDWWARQSDEAKKVFSDPNRLSLPEGLDQFEKYLRNFGIATVELWGNGSDFDNTITANAYKAIGRNAPWRFYNNRCFRTIKKMLGHQVMEPKRMGTHHNALDDAIFQAEWLMKFQPFLNR